MFVGMDFGTTNSAVALIDAAGQAEIVSFPGAAGASASTVRSMLAFDAGQRDAQRRLRPFIGQDAIDLYLHGDGECRLLQSFKSYLTSRSFSSTSILGTTYSLEDLIALVVGHLRAAAARGGEELRRVVAGRPVRFVAEGGEAEDDFATARLRDAFAKAGIDDLVFEYEPIAAAYYYERGLSRDETVLVADFGGGTSDFCLVRLGPGRRRLNRPEDAIIGTGGVGIAGDSFDRRIVQHGLAADFGKNASYRSEGRQLPIPAWIYGKFERWHHIGFLNTPPTLRLLRQLQRDADDPEALERLLVLIEHELGYHLYRAVAQTKLALSQGEAAEFVFDHDPIRLRRTITRSEFEQWIAEDLAAVENCVDGLLAATGTAPRQVDRVFMTGGSSLVPAVRAIFQRRFGAGKLSGGGEFVSVASGLAYRAREVFGG